MDAPNRTAHNLFVILSIVAVPAWVALALVTLLLGIELPASTGFLDLAGDLAILGMGGLAALTVLLSLIWLAVYRGTSAQMVGFPVWTVVFGLALCVNAIVFNGFVLRHMSNHPGGMVVRSYGEAIARFASETEGFVIWAQFWPLFPMALCAVVWRKTRQSALPHKAQGATL